MIYHKMTHSIDLFHVLNLQRLRMSWEKQIIHFIRFDENGMQAHSNPILGNAVESTGQPVIKIKSDAQNRHVKHKQNQSAFARCLYDYTHIRMC